MKFLNYQYWNQFVLNKSMVYNMPNQIFLCCYSMSRSKKDRFIRPIASENKDLAQAKIGGIFDSPSSVYSEHLSHGIFGVTHTHMKEASIFASPVQTAPPRPVLPPYKHTLTSGDTLDAPGLVNDYYSNLLCWGYRLVYIGLGEQLYFYNPETKKTGLISSDSFAPITAVSASREFVAKADAGKSLDIIDGKTLTTTSTIEADCVFSKIISDSNDNFYLASKAAGRVTQYDPRNNSFLFSLNIRDLVVGIACNPKSHLIGVSTSESIKLYDTRYLRIGMRTPEPKVEFKGHKPPSKALAFYGQDKIASGGGDKDKYLKIWDTKRGELSSKSYVGGQVCDIHWINAQCVAVTSGFNTNSVSLYQQKGDKLYLDAQETLDGRVLFAAQHPTDTTKIATGSIGSPNGLLKLWSIFTPVRKQKPSILSSSDSLQLR